MLGVDESYSTGWSRNISNKYISIMVNCIVYLWLTQRVDTESLHFHVTSLFFWNKHCPERVFHSYQYNCSKTIRIESINPKPFFSLQLFFEPWNPGRIFFFNNTRPLLCNANGLGGRISSIFMKMHLLDLPEIRKKIWSLAALIQIVQHIDLETTCPNKTQHNIERRNCKIDISYLAFTSQEG